jgi:hypothetical protein
MNLPDLLFELNNAYPGLERQYDPQTGAQYKVVGADLHAPFDAQGTTFVSGDTLAAYIVSEVTDAWADGPADDPLYILDQIRQNLDGAVRDLQAVVRKLERLREEIENDPDAAAPGPQG